MNPLSVVRPGTPVRLMKDILARVEEVRIDTSLTPRYGLSWWDGRTLCNAAFDRDEFEVIEPAPGLHIGFNRGA